jgi:hypothetical protein
MLDAANEQKVIDDIGKHGWHGVVIEPDEAGSGFEYSIGFMSQLHHPEVIIFGLPKKVSHDILWVLYHEIRKDRSFSMAGIYEDILEQTICEFRPVDVRQHATYLGYAMWHCRYCGKAGRLEAMQCFWPDKSGRFPWDSMVDELVADAQPRLDLPPSVQN